jgi:hypothetical protein
LPKPVEKDNLSDAEVARAGGYRPKRIANQPVNVV